MSQIMVKLLRSFNNMRGLEDIDEIVALETFLDGMAEEDIKKATDFVLWFSLIPKGTDLGSPI